MRMSGVYLLLVLGVVWLVEGLLSVLIFGLIGFVIFVG